jgi:uncharacterized protein with GYD domain
MAKYLSEMSLTPQAFQAVVQNPQNRADAVRPMIQAIGGQLDEYYFVVGENKVLVLLDMPDDVSVEAITMAVMAGGAINSAKAYRLMTAAEAVEAMRKAKDVTYKPPTA